MLLTKFYTWVKNLSNLEILIFLSKLQPHEIKMKLVCLKPVFLHTGTFFELFC